VTAVQVEVYLESTDKRAFACAYDWPGWARAGKTEAEAVDTLLKYARRYEPVAAIAGIQFGAGTSTRLRVVDRVPGNATTAFGAPSQVLPSDRDVASAEATDRMLALLRACWTSLDRIAASAPESLRKGPRGGGRDRGKILDHVLDAEAGYSRLLGLTLRAPDRPNHGAVAAHREALFNGLRNADATLYARGKGWPMRYATRRLAWHVLDHAWEIEDRTEQ